jgi:hypothetical protein
VTASLPAIPPATDALQSAAPPPTADTVCQFMTEQQWP